MDISHIIEAKRRISPYLRQTPVVSSSQLNAWLGHDIVFKAENLQRIGAFKARGACNFVKTLIEQGKTPKHIVASSSGNHAQAVAWAAKRFGIESTIYMARNVSSVKAQATTAYGAKVVLCDTRIEADRQTEEAAQEPGTAWAPPFDHEWIMAGQGTAALEALMEIGEVDAVFAPCGGGGLLSGTLLATRGYCKRTQVLGVEPELADDATRSFRTGSIQSLKAPPDTLADGVTSQRVGDKTFPYLQQLDDFFTVDEETIRYWTQWLNHLLKVGIEPTSAMTLGGVTQWLARQRGRKKVLVILSGGNVDQAKMLKIWQHDCLTRVPSLAPQ